MLNYPHAGQLCAAYPPIELIMMATFAMIAHFTPIITNRTRLTRRLLGSYIILIFIIHLSFFLINVGFNAFKAFNSLSSQPIHSPPFFPAPKTPTDNFLPVLSQDQYEAIISNGFNFHTITAQYAECVHRFVDRSCHKYDIMAYERECFGLGMCVAQPLRWIKLGAFWGFLWREVGKWVLEFFLVACVFISVLGVFTWGEENETETAGESRPGDDASNQGAEASVERGLSASSGSNVVGPLANRSDGQNASEHSGGVGARSDGSSPFFSPYDWGLIRSGPDGIGHAFVLEPPLLD